MSTLIIAEKNKAALAIAEALGTVKAIKKSKGISIYYVPSKNIYVVPLRGHILEHRNTDEYKSWINSVPREIITNPNSIKKYPKNYAGPYINALIEYGKQCDEIIIATDADIEGCNIGFFDALPFVKKVNSNTKISQLWLSSLQKNEIQRKFNNLIQPKFSWGEAGEARAIIDAVIGFSATREVTNTLRPILKKFKVGFTSIGRVQSSALYLLYIREKEIMDFLPEKYFTIDAILIAEKSTFKAYHKNNPFKKENMDKAKHIYSKIKDEKITVIKNYNQNLVQRKPPTPLNTNKALILLTKNLNINANTALNIMNQLYLNKIITYPRTDSDVYKPDFPHKDLIDLFKTHSDYGVYTKGLISNNRFTPTKGKKDAGDHPPISPLISLELESNELKDDLQKKVYDLLARHYLSLFGENATESKQDLDLLIKDEPFKAQIVSLVDPGFLIIAPFLKPKYDTEIQISGDKIPIENIELNEKETKPPPHYTDTTLLKLMEKNGLGTKSTRPAIIEIMKKRKVIDRKNGRYFISSLGIFLIENLIKVWLPFLKPTFTHDVETQLEMIKDEKLGMNVVIDKVKKDFLMLFDKFLANKEKLIANAKEYENEVKDVGVDLKERKASPLTTANCPFCKKAPMKLITPYKKRRFLVCTNEKCSKKYLAVPAKGKIQILDSTCKICGFNIFKIGTYKNNKYFNYFICPKCWTEGLETKSGKGFCSNCDNYKIVKNQCVKK
ncbi:MAG: hypothetical protein EU529_09455 [Promethearchaeota archaeon]|nr:MAG: hypothetical protein EU529_09455 [Candidatus Lokiarchaeota archaeon]